MAGSLLDTHAFIWYINGDSALSSKAIEAIEATPGNNYVSVASLWERAVKISLGKLELKQPFSRVAKEIEEMASRYFQLCLMMSCK